jgi:hypothetical protein
VHASDRLPDSAPASDGAPRARELAGPGPLLKNEDPASSRASFDDVVRPVEISDGGRPLHGQGRVDCEQAYATHPAGFEAAIAEALTGTSARSRRGVLVSLIREGFHIRAEELARIGVTAPPRQPARRYGRGLTARQIHEQTEEPE